MLLKESETSPGLQYHLKVKVSKIFDESSKTFLHSEERKVVEEVALFFFRSKRPCNSKNQLEPHSNFSKILPRI